MKKTYLFAVLHGIHLERILSFVILRYALWVMSLIKKYVYILMKKYTLLQFSAVCKL